MTLHLYGAAVECVLVGNEAAKRRMHAHETHSATEEFTECGGDLVALQCIFESEMAANEMIEK